MPMLRVHLLEGFAHDTVVVRVDGTEVHRASEVSTRQQIGLARSIEVDVAREPVDVQVELPDKNLTGTARVARFDEQHVFANVTRAGQLEVVATTQPLRL